MELEVRDRFTREWEKYFPGAELPIVFYYTDTPGDVLQATPPEEHRCFLAGLVAVRNGQPLCFDVESIGCLGGKRYLGFCQTLRLDFDYFLSCGIPGKLEGERYKKSPELVNQVMRDVPTFEAPGPFIVFKRWDQLEPEDNPEVVVFISPPDVIAGLFTLANFDEPDLNAVFAPFGAGCGTIVMFPYLEKAKERPRAVLGMFDVSARPWVHRDTLSFAVPINKFLRMIDNMPESFLITPSWQRIKARL